MLRGDFDRIAERVRNWGRWGPDDQRGTLNHIGPEALLRAGREVRQGKTISLGLPFDKNGPQLGELRFNPMRYAMALYEPCSPDYPDNWFYSDDVIHMPLQAATQWDALGHVHYDGEIYNGHCARDCLHILDGARRCGIEHLAMPGITSRGVLLDIARLKQVDRLVPGEEITVDDLNAACAAHGVTVEPGDIVLVRTGHIRTLTRDGDREAFNGIQPGVAVAVAEWVHERKVAAIASDNLAVEVLSMPEAGSEVTMPFHMLMLRDMGCPLGEIFDLDRLSDDCAGDGRYSFMLCAPPLPVTGGFGSPVNPTAIK